MISARALENGGFFFTAGPRERGKSSFSRKRLRWPIIFFSCFEMSSKFLNVKWIWANSQCWARNNRRKREFSKQSWLKSWCYYKDLYGINKVLLLLNEHGDPSFLFPNLSSYRYKQSSGKVWEKSQCRFYSSGMTLINKMFIIWCKQEQFERYEIK